LSLSCPRCTDTFRVVNENPRGWFKAESQESNSHSCFHLSVYKEKWLVFLLFFFLTGRVCAAEVNLNSPTQVPQSNYTLPTNGAECMQAAAAALQNNDINKAIESYLLAIKFDPKSWQVYQNLAGCYFKLGKIDEAKEAYKQCLIINPNNPELIKFIVQNVLPITPVPTATPLMTPTPAIAPAMVNGQLSLGARADVWNSNYAATTNGWELLFPASFSFSPWKDMIFYASSEFANGNYINQGGPTINLTAFSDTIAGAELGFQTLSLNSIINVWFNIPTGNDAWESETAAANIPEEFVDDRYQGRGFGVSGLYGISIPADSSKIGLSGGYMYAGDYNPNTGLSVPAVDLKLGDSIFCSVNRVTSTGLNQSDVFQASAFFFLPTLEQGQNFLWTGPNINLSYAWNNPTAFSFELGAQVYLPGQTAVNGQWTPDASYLYGPRLYLNPSYAFGDFTLAAQFKYILPNGYGSSSSSYDGGGYLLGIGPSYNFRMGTQEAIKVSAFYDYINALSGGVDANGNPVNVLYNLFTVGINYSLLF
jgi:tetratricopeptide (TPR) repeat protein